VFYKLLNNLADYLSKGQVRDAIMKLPFSLIHTHMCEHHNMNTTSLLQANEMKVLLASLYKQPIPLAAGSVTLQMVNDKKN